MKVRLLGIAAFTLAAASLCVSAGARAETAHEKAAALLVQRAEVLFARDEIGAAEPLVRTAVELHPSARARLLLARALVARGACDEAVPLLPTALDAFDAEERASVDLVILEARAACDDLDLPVEGPEDMVRLEGGRFLMGTDDGERAEGPAHEVVLTPFWIDRTEVTVFEFQACVDAGVCKRRHFKGAGSMDYCNYGEPTRQDHPMNCVDFVGARQYCRWVGRRLPTEAEWELAARGLEGRRYPWGSAEPDCHVAIMKSEAGDGCGADRTFAVGSMPGGATPDGVLDLAGNVWEWVADWYGEGYYAESPRHDPSGPTAGTERSMRGGSWLTVNEVTFRGVNRDKEPPDYIGNAVGFRCALSARGQ